HGGSPDDRGVRGRGGTARCDRDEVARCVAVVDCHVLLVGAPRCAVDNADEPPVPVVHVGNRRWGTRGAMNSAQPSSHKASTASLAPLICGLAPNGRTPHKWA